jgi:hypothetical protein
MIREVVYKYGIGKETFFPMDSLFTRFLVNKIIGLYRKDGRVVEGVALELLCRLFVYRGFESLSFRFC